MQWCSHLHFLGRPPTKWCGGCYARNMDRPPLPQGSPTCDEAITWTIKVLILLNMMLLYSIRIMCFQAIDSSLIDGIELEWITACSTVQHFLVVKVAAQVIRCATNEDLWHCNACLVIQHRFVVLAKYAVCHWFEFMSNLGTPCLSLLQRASGSLFNFNMHLLIMNDSPCFRCTDYCKYCGLNYCTLKSDWASFSS